MKPPGAKDRRPGSGARGLSPDEAALWARVAQTVAPLPGRVPAHSQAGQAPPSPLPVRIVQPRTAPPAPDPARPRVPPPARPLDRTSLDASWDRRLARGIVAPDFTLDLHGCTLDAAHARLDHGLALALAQGARLVLLVTGRLRPAEDHAIPGHHGRGERRGAIRAKFLDWLAAGPHGARIAAVRPAHPRHGGAGAVYIVLRRPR